MAKPIPIECSACCVEAAVDDGGGIDLDDWQLDGEFGVLCPSCIPVIDDGSSVGLEGLAEALSIPKEEP